MVTTLVLASLSSFSCMFFSPQSFLYRATNVIFQNYIQSWLKYLFNSFLRARLKAKVTVVSLRDVRADGVGEDNMTPRWQ